MDRRKNIATDESAASTSSLASISSSLKDLYLGISTYIIGDEEMKKMKPETVLQRMLSMRSAISTASSLAEANQRAHEDQTERRFTNIGQGQCGTIYALLGTTMVVKLPKNSQKVDELYNDFLMHHRVHKEFNSLPEQMRMAYNINNPAPKTWVTSKSYDFWSRNASLFPVGTSVPDFGLVSERIFPLPLPVRSAIVDVFAPKNILNQKEKFLSHPENKDCLVRLYLGRTNGGSMSQTLRLRNFPLHLDQMEQLGLNTEMFARTLAQALAILHWKVGVDANDVEYVLGSSPQTGPAPTIEELFTCDFRHRTISVWLLDFNQCSKFSENEDGMRKLVDGYWWNDPYYPRPSDKLWPAFAQHYLATSCEFNKTSMPKTFLDRVVAEGRKRSAAQSLFG